MDQKEMGFTTKAIRSAKNWKDPHGALNVPIYQSATFVFDDCQQGGNRFAGAESGYIYSRLGNPTTTALQDCMAALENTEAALGFSSGMGAITSVIWTICKTGDHIVADKTLYGCTFVYLEHELARFGIEITMADLADPENLKAALKDNTVLVYFETPANPTLKIVDIQQVCDIAHNHNKDIMVVCDNTFATPYLTRPADLGCDVVVHSATKYLNGHGDVIAGVACGTFEFMEKVRLSGLKNMTGSVIGPFDAYLTIRGLKSLEVRMDRHCANAAALADYLEKHPKVEKVYYPGLAHHQNHDVAKKQMSKFGGMIAFEVKGGREAGAQLLDNLEICTLTVSLGSAETLIEHPASMTHSTYQPDELERAGIPAGLIRLSVGIENLDNLLSDFDRGFQAVSV